MTENEKKLCALTDIDIAADELAAICGIISEWSADIKPTDRENMLLLLVCTMHSKVKEIQNCIAELTL